MKIAAGDESARRILVVGDAVASTGFARVTQAILERLRDRYEIHQLGINYHGDPHSLPWRVYPAGLGGDIHGVGRLASLIEWIRPEIVWLVNDPWIIADYSQVLATAAKKSATIAYVSIDSGPVDSSVVRSMQYLDAWVAFTRYGRQTLLAAAATQSTLFAVRIRLGLSR